MKHFAVLFLFSLILTFGEANKVLLITEKDEQDLAQLLEANLGSDVTPTRFVIDHDDDTDTTSFCTALAGDTFSAVIDLSWGGWENVQKIVEASDIPYVHVEASNKPFVMALDDFLYQRDAIDAALLFETETELDQVGKKFEFGARKC